ncbi:hypothetical protein VSR17_27680 [Cupriavidus taiwanensis]|uniref:Uncharacterized protein n=1 Tax=Cupriavidus taiwanensis TaxID=164546 RepID=A0A375IE25_9BURK|nr:hypothetical protein [Cupriavidus taiwanensis]SOZ22991.1 conserved hypothetical protein [Cupriavidus taiwanensis]SPA27188.1 conserved hypothetical protein [Cupriavidus taiwanensis]SPA44893.1 conserved hypothetical protein [Cupriavidus taiwanensis]SPK71602.1 conserved protein of unknown function [Cupriavidus taiwanensis]
MTKLTLTDLTTVETLDRKGMHAVRGGRALMPFVAVFQPLNLSFDKSITAVQEIAQMQSVTNMNGNGSAFLDHVKSNVHTNQNASNNIYG